MKTLTELRGKIEAGQTVVCLPFEGTAFQTDKKEFALVTQFVFVCAPTFDDLLQKVRRLLTPNESDHYIESLSCAFDSPTWQIFDTSLPSHIPQGKTLLQLRAELASGKTVYPTWIKDEQLETFRQSASDHLSHEIEGDSYYGYSRGITTRTYYSLEHAAGAFLTGLLPMWSSDMTPAYLAVKTTRDAQEKEAERKRLEEEALLNTLCTVEMSERDHRAWLKWKEEQADESFLFTDELP